ncbi:MAG: hypothetical protein J0M35_18055 [Candidatus Obscuribacter phosphatis]|uniref:Spermidine synthase n=1 Tax=Candidatus Obscuribacter phosphatis TaxID=1906157 RepID=A0A8J7P8U8_9BACT|nr:hypothetical protein [Candidatus Obscuribacter phosphatis]
MPARLLQLILLLLLGATSIILEVAASRLVGRFTGEHLAATLTLSFYMLGFARPFFKTPNESLNGLILATLALTISLFGIASINAPQTLCRIAEHLPGTFNSALLTVLASVSIYCLAYLSGAQLAKLSSQRPNSNFDYRHYLCYNAGAALGGYGVIYLLGFGLKTTLGVGIALLFGAQLVNRLNLRRENENEPVSPNENEPISVDFSDHTADSKSAVKKAAASWQPPSLLIFLSGLAGLLSQLIILRTSACLTGSAVTALALTTSGYITFMSLGNLCGYIVSVASGKSFLAKAACVYLACLVGESLFLDQFSKICGFYLHLSSNLDFVFIFLSMTISALPAFASGLLVTSIYGEFRGQAEGFRKTMAFNTAGAVLAPLIFLGLFSIPNLGIFLGLHRLQIAMHFLLLIAVFIAHLSLSSNVSKLRGRVTLFLMLLLSILLPVSDAGLTEGRINLPFYLPAAEKLLQSEKGLKTIYREDGFYSTIALEKSNDASLLVLKANGNIEATKTIKRDLAAPGQKIISAEPTHKLLFLLPYLLHESEPKQVLIIGLGLATTGDIAKAVLTAGNCQTIELEPEAIEAAAQAAKIAAVDKENAPIEGLSSSIKRGDGRLYLSLHKDEYDLVICQPSEPWVSGSASLFTREFLETARLRLTGDGIFCQWLQLYGLEPQALVDYVKTFEAVFPGSYIYRGRGASEIILVGAKQSRALNQITLQKKLSRLEPLLKRENLSLDELSACLHKAAGLGAKLGYTLKGQDVLDDNLSLQHRSLLRPDSKATEAANRNAQIINLQVNDQLPSSNLKE